MASKKQRNMQKHFAIRSIERLGVLLDEKEIIKQIQQGELPFLKRQSNRVSVFRYTRDEKNYRLVYDKIRKQLITILFEKELG